MYLCLHNLLYPQLNLVIINVTKVNSSTFSWFYKLFDWFKKWLKCSLHKKWTKNSKCPWFQNFFIPSLVTGIWYLLIMYALVKIDCKRPLSNCNYIYNEWNSYFCLSFILQFLLFCVLFDWILLSFLSIVLSSLSTCQRKMKNINKN